MSLNQFYTLLYFILTGVAIGILFDIFRILRRSFKTSDFITYIHDILFWILTGVILLFSIFTFNNGELRGYIFVGIIFGIIIYVLLFSKHFIKVFVSIINFIKKIVGYPIKIIHNFLKKFLYKPTYNTFHKIKLKLYKIDLKNNLKNKRENKINLLVNKYHIFKIFNRKNDKLSNKIQ